MVSKEIFFLVTVFSFFFLSLFSSQGRDELAKSMRETNVYGNRNILKFKKIENGDHLLRKVCTLVAYIYIYADVKG